MSIWYKIEEKDINDISNYDDDDFLFYVDYSSCAGNRYVTISYENIEKLYKESQRNRDSFNFINRK